MLSGTVKQIAGLLLGLMSAVGGVLVLLPDWNALLTPNGIGGLFMVVGSVGFMWLMRGLTGIQDQLAKEGRIERRGR